MVALSGYQNTHTYPHAHTPARDPEVEPKFGVGQENADGGFQPRYWFGSPDTNGRNLATCVWRSRGDAVKAGHTPGHRKASRATAAMYSEWGIDRHRLVVGEGAGRWELVDWDDADEGRVWGL